MTGLLRCAIERPRIVIAAWLLLMVAAAFLALHLPGVVRGGVDDIPGSPSQLAMQSMRRGFGADSEFTFPVVLESTQVSARDMRFGESVTRLERLMLDSGNVRSVRHFWNTGATELLGADGRSALLLVSPRANSVEQAKISSRTIRAELGAADLGPTFSAKATGSAAVLEDMNRHSADDLLAAERVAVPLTLIILVLAFAAPLAACLPLLLAFAAVLISLGGLAVIGQYMPVSVFARNAVTMIGLGVGVDYALVLLSRYRAELAQGCPASGALATAAMRSGAAVAVSGLTVATGFFALLLVPIPGMPSLAIGGALVVLVAVAATLTLMPAVLSQAGERVFWPFSPSARRQPRMRTAAIWSRWANFVMRRAWLAIVVGLAVVAILVTPAFHIKSWYPGAKDLPRTLEARQGADALQKNFGEGWLGPVALVLESEGGGTVWEPARQRAVLAVARRLAGDPRVAQVGGFPSLLLELGALRETIDSRDALPSSAQSLAAGAVSRSGRHALIVLIPSDAPESPRTLALVDELRRDTWPEVRATSLSVRIAGSSAAILDFDQELFGALWRVIPAALLVTYLILLIQFRSVLIPLKAILLNLVSVLASWGLLVLVFQYGAGASLLGLDAPGGLNGFVVLMLFTILFGLSMDYEVFLLSRIKEEREQGADNATAVRRGIEHTAGTITSAALVMVCIFASFACTNLVATQQFGIGLAFAVLIDATLIRVVLVPALMQLLGSRNWWMPRVPGLSGRAQRAEVGPNGR